MAHVLVVDDQPAVRTFLERLLERGGHAVSAVGSAREARRISAERPWDVVLLDLVLPDARDLELLTDFRREQPGAALVVMTAHGEIDTAVRCLRAGADDFLSKPFQSSQLLLTIERLLEDRRRRRELTAQRLRHTGGQGVGGVVLSSHPAMQEIYETIRRLASSGDTTVLLEGESGVGKDVLARMIHASSPRAEAPLLDVNCAALPESLLESELFGHVRGAFTGADTAKPGLLVMASGGTLFLDEVGEMSPALQAKLLTVLERQVFRPVGGVEDVHVDLRLIAATNRDLRRMVAEGKFREDLYYRLQVVTLRVPPLRERPEDIEPLVTHFLAVYNTRFHKRVDGLTEAARKRLLAHPWPGNVRELRNVIERAVLLAAGDRLDVADLRLEAPQAAGAPAAASAGGGGDDLAERLRRAAAGEWNDGIDLPRLLEDLERRCIATALRRTGGNKTAAARLIGLNRDKLRYRLKEYELDA